MGDLWDLFPAVFLLSWAAYNWVAYKYPERVPNPFGLAAPGTWETAEPDEEVPVMALGTSGACIRCEREVTLTNGVLCGMCETEGLLTGDESHPNAQLGLDRLSAEGQDNFNVKPVWLTHNERSIVTRALTEYLEKAGQIRGCPEAELWVRAVLQLVHDVDEGLPDADLPEPIDHESWRQDQMERTGTDPVTGTEVDP